MTLYLWAGASLVGVCALLAAPSLRRPAVFWILAVFALYPLIDLWRRPDTGWDLGILCGGWRALRADADPYLIAELRRFTGSELPLPYPAFWIAALSPLCATGGHVTMLLQLLMLAGAYALVPRERKADGALCALLVGGLAGFYWNIYSGNHGLIELLLIAAFYRCASGGHLVAAGGLLGLLGSFKLLPVAYLLALLAWWRLRGPRTVAVAALAGVAVLGAVHLISWAIAPALYPSFLARILDVYHDPAGPLLEMKADITSPTPWLCVVGLPDGHVKPLKTVVLLVAFVVALLAPLKRFAGGTSASREAGNGLDVASWVLIVLALLSPRLKPYSYTHLLLPLFWLTRGLPAGRRIAVVTTATAVPALHFVFAPRLSAPGTLGHLLASGQALAAIAAALLCGYARRDKELPVTPPLPGGAPTRT